MLNPESSYIPPATRVDHAFRLESDLPPETNDEQTFRALTTEIFILSEREKISI
jgi:hypothetical protein